MKYARFLVAATLASGLFGCGAPANDTSKQPVASGDATFYFGARLIPGDGSAPIDDATFIVDNGKFLAIGKKDELHAPKGAGRVDMTGQTLMPMLVNLDAHAGVLKGASFSPDNYNRQSVIDDLDRYAYYGVGDLLTFGTDAGDLAVHIRDEQKQGKQNGARLFTSGRGITAKGGWPSGPLKNVPIQVSNETEARHAVQDNADNKVDMIALWVDDANGKTPKLKPELYKAIIDEAHKHNLHVVADASDLADAKELAKDGIDGFVASIRDKEVDADFISTLKSKKIFLAPALTAIEARFVYVDSPKWLGEQSMREVYPGSLSAFLSDPVTVNRMKRDPATDKYRSEFATATKNLKKLADGGVTIVLGTNSGTPNTLPGYFEQRELELMANAGMSPNDVIKAATSSGASVLGIADAGSLTTGKNADFISMTSNPLEKITNSKEIASIYKGGSQIDRTSLIRNLTQDVTVPKITAADRAEEAKAEQLDAQAKADAKLPHFGKFPLGPSARVGALTIPTPKGSKVETKPGSPAHVTVSMSAKASDLQEFYTAAMANFKWKTVGSCWERVDSVSNKTATACLTAGANSANFEITFK